MSETMSCEICTDGILSIGTQNAAIRDTKRNQSTSIRSVVFGGCRCAENWVPTRACRKKKIEKSFRVEDGFKLLSEDREVNIPRYYRCSGEWNVSETLEPCLEIDRKEPLQITRNTILCVFYRQCSL
jgi:hypothetical protein